MIWSTLPDPLSTIQLADATCVLRRVRPTDKPRVLAFTQHTWGEHDDYISDVFDDWVDDPDGLFIAATIEEQPVAIGRVVALGEDEFWLEGLRVDPAQRKRGIGEALHMYHVDLVRHLGGKMLRYATGSDNIVSQMFGARSGFTHICDFRSHRVDASASFSQPECLTVDDEKLLMPWLDASVLRSAHGTYACDWKWPSLSHARLYAHLNAGEVYGLRDGTYLRAWAIGKTQPSSDVLELLYLDAVDHVSMIEMAQSLRRVASDAGMKTIEGLVLSPSRAQMGLSEAGYAAGDFDFWIMELKLK